MRDGVAPDPRTATRSTGGADGGVGVGVGVYAGAGSRAASMPVVAEAPLGYAESADEVTVEHDEDVLQSLKEMDDFA